MIALLPFGLLCLLSLVLAWIDIRHGIIPDWLNLAIAGLGLSKALIVDGPPFALEAACEGAAIGATFWLLRRLYFAFRKIQGLGLGDVKFLAAAGIWVGVTGLPMLLLVAVFSSAGRVAKRSGGKLQRLSLSSRGGEVASFPVVVGGRASLRTSLTACPPPGCGSSRVMTS